MSKKCNTNIKKGPLSITALFLGPNNTYVLFSEQVLRAFFAGGVLLSSKLSSELFAHAFHHFTRFLLGFSDQRVAAFRRLSHFFLHAF